MRPSDIVGLRTPWGAYQLDVACLYTGREAEKAVADGKQPFGTAESAKPQNFRDPRGMRRIKKVRVKPDGTW